MILATMARLVCCIGVGYRVVALAVIPPVSLADFLLEIAIVSVFLAGATWPERRDH